MEIPKVSEESTIANIPSHHQKTKTVRDYDAIDDTITVSEANTLLDDPEQEVIHEPLEHLNILTTSEHDTTTERQQDYVRADVADLTISETEILEVVGEELNENTQIQNIERGKKISTPSSNVTSSMNTSEVIGNQDIISSVFSLVYIHFFRTQIKIVLN